MNCDSLPSGACLLVAFCAIGVFQPRVSFAQSQQTVIRVPQDRPTIQAAVTGAGSNTLILVSAGDYLEQIVTNNPNITIRGSATGRTRLSAIDNRAAAIQIESGQLTLENLYFVRLSQAPILHAINGFGSTLVLRNCHFDGLGGTQGGIGAIQSSRVTAEHCSFRNNSASHSGGAIYANSSVVLRHCWFESNRASIVGGAVFGGGAIEAQNCVFAGNHSDQSGGAIRGGNPSLLRNCTFARNTTRDTGFALSVANAVIENCVFWENARTIAGQGSAISAPSLAVAHSITQEPLPGPGNITADPLFVNAAAGDFRLRPESPAIDAGNNAAIEFLDSRDLAGNPRFRDRPLTPDTGSGSPGAPIVDIGAYEYQPNPCTADVANPGDGVNATDLFTYLDRWFAQNGTTSCD